MQREIRRVGKYILFLLFLICFGYMLSLHASLSRSGTPVIYYLEDNLLTYDTLTSMREETEETTAGAAEKLSYTAIGTVENQTFSNEVLSRSAAGTLFLIDGSSVNLVSSTGELMAGDLTGCVISTEAAWELFGETEVSGGEILCGCVSCEVRGVYEDTECVVILPAEAYMQAMSGADGNSIDVWSGNAGDNGDAWSDSTGGSNGDAWSGSTGGTDSSDGGSTAAAGLSADSINGVAEISFDKLIVVPDEKLSDAERNEVIELFETTNSVGGERTDCLIYQRLATFFVMLIPAILMFCLAGRGIAGLVKNRRRPFRLVLLCAALIITFAVFFHFFQISPSIPADLIPNTWSDFDFWRDKLAEFVTGIRHLLFQNKSEIELNYSNFPHRLV